MKSVHFSLLNTKFDDQYTFDLQGYLSVQDFCSTFNLLNQYVRNNPPPGNKLTWFVHIWVIWLFIIIANYCFWAITRSSCVLVTLPFFMIFIALLFIWKYRVLCQKFEFGIISICNQINATENIRGINYRLSKNGSDVADFNKQLHVASNSTLKTIYFIVIEFDDRYNTLSSQQYNRYSSMDFVTVPLSAHFHHAKKDERNGLFPTWSETAKCQQLQQYDEKFIIHYR